MEKLNIQDMSANELSSYIGEITQGNLITKEKTGRGLQYILKLFQREMKEKRAYEKSNYNK